MTDILLTPRAKKNFEEIKEFSADNWSAEVANKYKDDLNEGIAALKNPKRGSIKEHYPDDYLVHFVRSHVVIYKYSKEVDTVFVLNILHQKWPVKEIVESRKVEINKEISSLIKRIKKKKQLTQKEKPNKLILPPSQRGKADKKKSPAPKESQQQDKDDHDK